MLQVLIRFCWYIVLKAEVDKLDVNKLVNVANGLNNLKRKEYDLDVKLKTVPVDLKKNKWYSEKEILKNTKFNKLNTKVNNLMI